jgi:hypothetical protein
MKLAEIAKGFLTEAAYQMRYGNIDKTAFQKYAPNSLKASGKMKKIASQYINQHIKLPHHGGSHFESIDKNTKIDLLTSTYSVNGDSWIELGLRVNGTWCGNIITNGESYSKDRTHLLNNDPVTNYPRFKIR